MGGAFRPPYMAFAALSTVSSPRSRSRAGPDRHVRLQPPAFDRPIEEPVVRLHRDDHLVQAIGQRVDLLARGRAGRGAAEELCPLLRDEPRRPALARADRPLVDQDRDRPEEVWSGRVAVVGVEVAERGRGVEPAPAVPPEVQDQFLDVAEALQRRVQVGLQAVRDPSHINITDIVVQTLPRDVRRVVDPLDRDRQPREIAAAEVAGQLERPLRAVGPLGQDRPLRPSLVGP